MYGRIKYYLAENKNSFYAAAGLSGSFNFPSSKSDEGYFQRTTFNATDMPRSDRISLDASSSCLSMVISAGMEINLSAKWNLFIEPSYTHSFSAVIRHPSYDKIPIDHFWRTFSLGTGLMYKF